jgi:hypothetical protein
LGVGKLGGAEQRAVRDARRSVQDAAGFVDQLSELRCAPADGRVRLAKTAVGLLSERADIVGAGNERALDRAVQGGRLPLIHE